MIESPRVTVVLALVKLSAGLDGTIGSYRSRSRVVNKMDISISILFR